MDTTDGAEVRDLVAGQLEEGIRVHAAVEVPRGRPPKTGGYKQISTQWLGIGIPIGVLVGLSIGLTRMPPPAWQKLAFDGQKTPKAYADKKRLSLKTARERWPDVSLRRVKDGGLADALWMALAVQRAEIGAQSPGGGR